jgi:hypothetical protein
MLIRVMDSLRADPLSCCVYGRRTTPIIDGRVTQGVRFSDAFADVGRLVYPAAFSSEVSCLERISWPGY